MPLLSLPPRMSWHMMQLPVASQSARWRVRPRVPSCSRLQNTRRTKVSESLSRQNTLNHAHFMLCTLIERCDSNTSISKLFKWQTAPRERE